MRRKLGIKIKAAIITIMAMSLLTIAIGYVGYFQFSKNVMENYIKYADMVLGLSNEIFEKYEIGDMVENEEMPEEYEEARLELNKVKNNADIMYLYAIYFKDLNDLHSISYVINAKNDEELNEKLNEGLSLNDIYSYMGESCEEDAFAESTLKLFYDALNEQTTEMRYEESTTTEYGHLITCYRPIFDSKGKAVGILGVDIDVNKINRDLGIYLRTIVIVALCLTVAVIILYMIYIQRFIINPVAALSQNADKFVALMRSEVEPENLVYEEAKVVSKDEIKLLSDAFSGMAGGVKKYMSNLQNVTAEKERIGAELNVATQIQADMLPCIFPAFPDRKDFDIYASMTPAKEVGGDFYDFFLLDKDHIALVMADVSGKGVPAALFMVISKTLIKDQAQMCRSPKTILEDVNNKLIESNAEGMFVTVWLGILEISTGRICAANAGHEYPAIRNSEGKFELLKDKHGMMVGAMQGINYKEYELTLGKGECLFLYTDGVPEATNADNELFGTDRMIDALNKEPMADPDKLLENVKKSVDEFVGEAPQFDDLTMLAIRLN